MKLMFVALLLSLLPMSATAQAVNPLSRCDQAEYDKFKRMDCIDKLQKGVEQRVVALENKIVRDLEKLERTDSEAKNLELSKNFKDSQRAWREFTDRDCYSIHALPGANGMGGLIRDCAVIRYVQRERALKIRAK